MKYNFDELIDRRNTASVKVDALENLFGNANLIPLWVADMDFLSPPCITEALKKRVEHGVFGYTYATDEYYQSIYRKIVESMIKNPDSIDIANQLVWVVHNLERTADRVTNICERVVFIVSGELMEFDNTDDETIGLD